MEPSHTCNECQKTFTRKNNLYRHRNTTHRKRTYWCTTCYKLFNRKDNLRKHERCHPGERLNKTKLQLFDPPQIHNKAVTSQHRFDTTQAGRFPAVLPLRQRKPDGGDSEKKGHVLVEPKFLEILQERQRRKTFEEQALTELDNEIETVVNNPTMREGENQPKKDKSDFKFERNDFDDDLRNMWEDENDEPEDYLDSLPNGFQEDKDLPNEDEEDNNEVGEKVSASEIYRRFQESRDEKQKKEAQEKRDNEEKIDAEVVKEFEKENEEALEKAEKDINNLVESLVDNLEDTGKAVVKTKQQIVDEFKNRVIHMHDDDDDEDEDNFEHVTIEPEIETHDELPPLVTAVSRDLYEYVLSLVQSVQVMLPNHPLLIYDLDLSEEQKAHLKTACNVELRPFFGVMFPEHVQDVKNYHWRPIIIQAMLAEFGHVIWINPTVKLINKDVKALYRGSVEHDVTLVADKMGFSTWAVTHEDMFLYLETEMESIKKHPHLSIKMIVLHNTDNLQAHIMKWLINCIVEKDCISPENSTWQCNYDFTYKKHALCHMYDESAMNILFKNWFHYDDKYFVVPNTYTTFITKHVKPKPFQSCAETKPDRTEI